MQAMWNSQTGKVTLVGKHIPGKPRHWTVCLRIANDNANERIVFKPEGKMLLTDLEALVGVHTDEFEKEHGEITEASWIATAR